ncbi:MAG: hypothetical protein ACRD0H_13260, partial [Actinomycetes bacterium]
HQAALSWRLEQFSGPRARVAVWNVTVLALDGVASPQASWSVTTFDLIWERGDWKVLADKTQPGPAPMLDDSAPPATTAELARTLDGFTDFTDVA